MKLQEALVIHYERLKKEQKTVLKQQFSKTPGDDL